MKLLVFTYYTLKEYYSSKWEAFISLLAILLINALTVYFTAASYFQFTPMPYRKGEYFYDRLMHVSFFILPIAIIIVMTYFIFKLKINNLLILYKRDKRGNRKRKKWMILYFIMSVLLFMFGIVSSKIF